MPTVPSPVRVRFAPSPTGYLHVGGARTALYNFLYARKMSGTFVLRIEDTDQARSTEQALRMQMGDLKWLGLHWDEGPDVGGPYGPYKQSERLEIYLKHANQLLETGKAYYCFCTDEELEKKKQAAMAAGLPPHYDGKCRHLPRAEALARKTNGEKAAVRFNIGTPKDYTFKDIIRDEITFPASMVGDFIMLRSDGMPVYNFCCVMDDALMKITHVLRAEEHLSNTLRQIMIYEAFGYEPPQFGHLSIILGADRQKLSKRHGATSCNEYRLSGYLPQALNNFIALLGWSASSGEEIMSRDVMIQQFGLDRFHSAAAVFDDVKLKWMNATYLRALSDEALAKEVQPFLDAANLKIAHGVSISSAMSVLKTSMETLADVVPLVLPLSTSHFEVFAESAEALAWPSTVGVLSAWLQGLQSSTTDHLSESDFMALQDQVKVQADAKGKFLFMAIRLAVIGKPQGTELKQIVPLIPRSLLIEHAKIALAKASASKTAGA
jgi:nondiscriminating glutamyl-tRNA synthetase